MRTSGVAQSLHAIGIIDRDYYSDPFIEAVPDGMHVLPVHEPESLLALPAVVDAVGQHLGRTVDLDAYLLELRATVTQAQRHAIVIRRWKARIEPHLTGLVASTNARAASLDTLIGEMPDLFDMTKWAVGMDLPAYIELAGLSP